MLNIKLIGKGANALSEKISKTGLICNIKSDDDGDKSLRVLLTGDTSEITLGVSIVSSLSNTMYTDFVNDSGMVENETWSLNTIARPKFKRRQLIKGGVNIVLYIEVIRPNIAFGYNADDVVSELKDKRLLNGCDYFTGTPPGTNGCTICINKGFDSLIVTNIMKYISERYDVRDISRSSRPTKSFELTVKENIKAQAVGAMNITPGAGKLTNWGIPDHYMPDNITDPVSIMVKLETTCKRINKQNCQYEKLHSEHRLVNAENKRLSVECDGLRKTLNSVLDQGRTNTMGNNLLLKDELTALQNYIKILETEREQLKNKLDERAPYQTIRPTVESTNNITEERVWLSVYLKHLRHDNSTQCVELANNSVIEFKKVFNDK